MFHLFPVGGESEQKPPKIWSIKIAFYCFPVQIEYKIGFLKTSTRLEDPNDYTLLLPFIKWLITLSGLLVIGRECVLHAYTVDGRDNIISPKDFGKQSQQELKVGPIDDD